MGYSYHNRVLLHSLPHFIFYFTFYNFLSSPGVCISPIGTWCRCGFTQWDLTNGHKSWRTGWWAIRNRIGPWSPMILAEERWVRLQRAWRIWSALNKEIKVDSTTWAWWRATPCITGHGTWPHTTLVQMSKPCSRLLVCPGNVSSKGCFKKFLTVYGMCIRTFCLWNKEFVEVLGKMQIP